MAKFDGKFFRGLIGKLIFRERKGQQEVSAKPIKIRQTKATKAASGTFSMASTLGGEIRHSLANELSLFNDGSIHCRLNGELNSILSTCRDRATNTFRFEEDSFHNLVGLELNSNARLSKNLPGKLTVDIQDGLLNIGMPGGETLRKLKFVKGSTDCKMMFTVALYRLHEGFVCRQATRQSLMVMKRAPDLNGITFSFEVPSDCLCLVTATLEYYAGGMPIHDINLNCCTVIEAIYMQGVYDTSSDFLWYKGGLIFQRA